MSELSTIGLKLEDDIKLAIILNGLPERYRYLVVSLEKEEKIDFDELTARLLEEELKVNPGAAKIALTARKNARVSNRESMKKGAEWKGFQCYACGAYGHRQWECPKWRARQEGWATGEEAFQPAQKEKTEKAKYAM